jgi:hypothetical protein
MPLHEPNIEQFDDSCFDLIARLCHPAAVRDPGVVCLRPGMPLQALSSGDKSSIYDWLRQAACNQSAAEQITSAIQAAIAQSACPEEFDELMIKAMLVELT